MTAKGLADQTALLTRKEAWAEAYRDTPHGTPVELRDHESLTGAGFSLGSLPRSPAYWLIQQATWLTW